MSDSSRITLVTDVKRSRKEKAATTRARMLDAAHASFVDRGYPGTTMASIADRAGVAVQTLYFTFHTKAELLGEVFERAVFGDDAVPPPQQEWFRAAKASPDLDDALRTWVTGVASIVARVAPLRPVFDGVGPDEAVAELWARGEQFREDDYGAFLDALIAGHGLAAGASREEVLDLALVMVGPVGHRGFVEDREWNIDQWIDLSVRTLRERFAGTE